MNAKKWGSNMWHLIHTIGINSNINKKNYTEYINLINSFKTVIPCQECKEHFKANLYYYPPEVVNFTDKYPIDWSYSMHNMINNQIGKKSCIYKYAIRKHKKVNHKKINNCVNFTLNYMNRNCSFRTFLDYKQFLKSLLLLYPCKKCRNKYKLKIKKIDDIHNKKDLLDWYKKNKIKCM